MAANIPQMVANGQMMMLQQQQQQQQQQQPQQPQGKQLHQLVYSHLMQSMSMAPMNSWQSGVSISDRFAKAINLVTNTLLAFPNLEWQKLFQSAMDHEKKAFMQSPDKQSYDHAMATRNAELVKRRQGHVPDLQNQINSDAAARQAQLAAQQQRQQMLLNQMAARGALGQGPQHGFMPNQMQVPGIPQQPPQMGMGIAGPGMVQNRPDQRQFPMQVPQQPRQPGVFQVEPLRGLSPQERTIVNDMAVQLMERANDATKNQIRQAMQQRWTPAQLQECAAKGLNPVFVFYQNSALNQLHAARAAQPRNLMQQRPGLPAGVMQQAAHQGQMNPALMGALAHQAAMAEGKTFPPNMESIHTDQQMALRAQQPGQMVVPPTTAAGRNPTASPMVGVPPHPTPGGQAALNQTPRPPQVQQTSFGMPQVNIDPTVAAQGQAQPGAQGVPRRPMQNQPGAMVTPTAPSQPSQSPAMNTLNAPMRQPPVPNMGQANGQPLNAGNPPMAATLNPQFNHVNNTRPPSLQANMNNPAMAGMVPNLTPEARAAMSGLPENAAMREFYAKLQENQRAANTAFPGAQPGVMPGVPGQLQPGQLSGQSQAAMVNAMQKVNGAMPSASQPAAMQPQQQAAERDQLMAILGTPQGRVAMNNMDIPPQVLARVAPGLPAEIRKWGQLRQFIQNNPGSVPANALPLLNSLQVAQFKSALEKRRAPVAPAAAPQPPNAPGPQQPSFQPQALPPGHSYPPNIAHVTRQDLEAARQKNQRFQTMPDELLIEFLRKARRDGYARKAWEQFHQTRGNNNATGVPKPAVPVPPTPASQPGIVTAAPHPNAPQGVQPQAAQATPAGPPAAEMAKAPSSGSLKHARPPPNPSPAPGPKNLKRPSPDDTSDVSAQPSNAAQRPAPQPEARAPGTAPKPSTEQLMKLSPEQLAKITPEQMARLTPEQRAIVMRSRTGGSAPQDESIVRLRELAREAQQIAFQETQKESQIPRSAAEVQEMRLKLAKVAERMLQLRSQVIAPWYRFTKDDSRARMFFKTRGKVIQQFHDSETLTRMRDVVTVPKEELDQFMNMMESIFQDLKSMPRPVGQEPAAAATQVPQPSPLSAANLEKQTQALKQAQNRTAAKPVQPPAAPTTTQPPFQFGIQKSPAGNPEYFGEPRVTQLNLPPARKKAKTGTGQASPPAPQQQAANSSSPQVNAPSPVAARKPAPPKLTCPEPGCEMNSIGFPTEEALNTHRQEDHVKPFENPFGFLQEQMTAALGLDAQGKPKAPSKPSSQGVSTPAAPPMAASLSKQGQKPGPQPMSRGASMQRNGSAAGTNPKAGESAGTPGRPTPGAKPHQAATGGTPQMLADDPWASSTIDPQDLFSGLDQSLDAITGGFAVPDFGPYRSLTPRNDDDYTPESSASKESGASSEAMTSSDIAEGAALDIDLQWQQAIEGDLMWDMGQISVENFEEMGGDGADGDVSMFGAGNGGGFGLALEMEQMGNDFSKPFRVDQELYSGL